MESSRVLSTQVRQLDDRIATASNRARVGLAVVAFLGVVLVAGNAWAPEYRLIVGLALFIGAVLTLGFLLQLADLAQRTRELTATLTRGLESVAAPLAPDSHPDTVPATSLEEHALSVFQRVKREIDRRNRVGEELDRRVWEATTLYDLMLRMSDDLDLEAALKMALYSSMGVFGVTEGLIFLPTEFALEATTVRLVNEPGDRLVRLPLDEPLRAAIADLSRPLPWSEIEARAQFVPFAAHLARAFPGFAPQIACPLAAHGKLVGLMLLGAKITREGYTAENVRLLETIAPAVALTIRNARSLRTLADTNRQLDRKVFELELLNEISRNLNVVGDLGDILATVLELSARGVVCDGGAVHLFEPSSSTLQRAALCGPLPPLEGAPAVPIGQGLLGSVGQSLKPLVIGPGHPFGAQELGFAPSADVTSILSVPLTLERRLVGLLTMVNKTGGGPFSESDLSWMQTVANHAASVIENLRLFKLATEDGLTGLYVHRYFQIRLREELSRALRHARPVSLVFVDIDHFKGINDQFGHQTGDVVLRDIARLIRQNLREIDVAARYGGEEMAVILPETDAAGAIVVAERIRRAIEGHSMDHGGHTVRATASFGIGTVQPKEPIRSAKEALEELAKDLVKSSDQAVYAAKRGGRNRTETLGVLAVGEAQASAAPAAPVANEA